MKKAPISFLLCFLICSAYCQNYEPKILILAPHATTFDKKYVKEIDAINSKMQRSPKADQAKEYVKAKEFATEPENIQLMTLSEISFLEKMDFSREVSYLSHQYLSYRFFERFTNLLILLSNNTSDGNLKELKTLADKENMQYVLNFPQFEIYKGNDGAHAKIRVQLYDNVSGETLINKDFDGGSRNPGFEFTCEDKSLGCTINNALSAALAEVIRAVATNSPTLKRERQLSQQRYEELVTNHLPKPNHVEPLKTIIDTIDDNLSLKNIYQVLYDDTRTKFVAFSVEQIAPQDFRTFKDNKKDKNVNIITSKDIKDAGFLKEMPQTYAFIIKGVKYKDTWYYEKANVTYFQSESMEEARKYYFNNLQKWNFFIENTALVSPAFWDTGLFEKVPDLRKDPDWEKYGESSWKTREADNRPYIGMYQIAANVIRKNKREENEKFEKATKEEKLRPKYEQMKNSRPDEITKYSDQALIFPSEKNVVINPVLLTNKKGIHTLHYYVLFAGSDDLYEWTYFSPEQVDNGNVFGSNVVDRMSTITSWNFGFDTLDDEEFWNKYVLLKEGDRYKYLKKVE